MKHRIGPFVLAGGLAASAGVGAHHSAVMFDTAREIAVTGTVTRYEWRNPHVYMAVQTVAEDGESLRAAGRGGGALGPQPARPDAGFGDARRAGHRSRQPQPAG